MDAATRDFRGDHRAGEDGFPHFFAGLPLEMIGRIVFFLPHSALKQARLVNKAIKLYAQQSLFHTINLKMNVDSFLNLERISRSSELASYVRKIFYDGRLLPWARDDVSFGDYLDRYFGRNIVLSDEFQGASYERRLEIRKTFQDRFTTLESMQYFGQFCRLVNGQNFLHRYSGWTETSHLRVCFERFKYLTQIELNSGEELPADWYGEDQIGTSEDDINADSERGHREALRKLSSVTQTCMCAPWSDPSANGNGAERLRALMHAAHLADRQITSLSVSTLNPEELSAKVQPTASFRNLVVLKVVLNPPGYADGISMLLKLTPNVERLWLSFEAFISPSVPSMYRLGPDASIDGRMDELLGVFDTEEMLPRLRHLTLNRFVASESAFKAFTEVQTAKLSAFILCNASFHDWSLVDMVNYLAKRTKFERFGLEGKFVFGRLPGSSWYETWTFNRSHERCSSPHCCTLHGLESHVLGSSSWPFDLTQRGGMALEGLESLGGHRFSENLENDIHGREEQEDRDAYLIRFSDHEIKLDASTQLIIRSQTWSAAKYRDSRGT